MYHQGMFRLAGVSSSVPSVRHPGRGSSHRPDPAADPVEAIRGADRGGCGCLQRGRIGGDGPLLSRSVVMSMIRYARQPVPHDPEPIPGTSGISARAQLGPFRRFRADADAKSRRCRRGRLAIRRIHLAAACVAAARAQTDRHNVSTSRMVDEVGAPTRSRHPQGGEIVVEAMVREGAAIGGEGNGVVYRALHHRDSLSAWPDPGGPRPARGVSAWQRSFRPGAIHKTKIESAPPARISMPRCRPSLLRGSRLTSPSIKVIWPDSRAAASPQQHGAGDPCDRRGDSPAGRGSLQPGTRRVAAPAMEGRAPRRTGASGVCEW
jgi:hypothetical protein